MFLAGDIGGTKTHLALFSPALKILREKSYASRDFNDLEEIVRDFLKEEISQACFGIAGPVQNGKCHTTNLPWLIDAAVLQKNLSISKVSLLNDLEANAWGTFCLKPDELKVLQSGVETNGNRALIAAGTGLGEAGLFWDGKTHHPFATEGGHSDFAPRDEMEMELLRYLREKFEHVSYERVLCGAGIYEIYRFLIDMQLEKDEEAIRKAFAGNDPAKVITEKALSRESAACIRTLEWFASLYGSEMGNLALKHLAVGGIYIGGGIAPKILPFLESGIFIESFLSKGRFRGLLSAIPIKAILNQSAALIGAAKFCLTHSKG